MGDTNDTTVGLHLLVLPSALTRGAWGQQPGPSSPTTRTSPFLTCRLLLNLLTQGVSNMHSKEACPEQIKIGGKEQAATMQLGRGRKIGRENLAV